MPAATWIAHVKSVYAKGNMTYKEAMQRAAKTWKKSKGAKAAPARKSRGRKRKTKDEPEDAEDADDRTPEDVMARGAAGTAIRSGTSHLRGGHGPQRGPAE